MTKKIWHILILSVVFLLIALPFSKTFAVLPDEILSDATLEARARNLSQEIRCLVCQNETIDDSNASLARDLRILIRERLKRGDTDDQVRQFIVSRYGEFVLLKPPLSKNTVLLWASPMAVFIVALIILFACWHYRSSAKPQPLDAKERRDLERILERID